MIRAQNIKNDTPSNSEESATAAIAKIKAILPNCGHYNGNVRKDSTLNVLKCLKEVEDLQRAAVLGCLDPILVATLRQICDEDVAVRTAFLGLMTFLLENVKRDNLASFFPRWISFLNLASSHIKPEIRRDSVRFIAVTLRTQKTLFTPYLHTIIPTLVPLLTQYPLRQGAVPAFDCTMNLIGAYLEPFRTKKEADERMKPLVTCVWREGGQQAPIQIVRSSPFASSQGSLASNPKPQPIPELALRSLISHLSNLSISIWLDNLHLLKTRSNAPECRQLQEILALYKNLFMLTKVSGVDEEVFWRSMPVKLVKTHKTQLGPLFTE